MRKPPSPGPLLLAATSTCTCGWVGLECDQAAAVVLWGEHAQGRDGHELQSTTEE